MRSMLIKSSIMLLSLCFLLLTYAAGHGQEPQNGDWFNVQSDDGEFSAEVPIKYRFLYNESGFSVGSGIGHHSLTKMEMLNAVVNGALISVERYYASKDALSQIHDSDRNRSSSSFKLTDTSQDRPDGTKYRQIVKKADQYYSVRQYFYTKDHIYILTAASRNGETSEIRRFLDSVLVQMKPPASVRSDATIFSNLQHSDVQIEDLSTQPTPLAPPTPSANQLLIRKPDPNEKPVVFVERPLPSFGE